MSINMQRRPEFQHYPLNKQQLSDLSQQRQVLDKDIRENLNQIRMLNNKMAKNDYQMTYLHRLQERQKILDNKRRQMDQILRTHQYLQDQVNINKQNQQTFRTTLASQYKNVMEEKKHKQQQEKRRKIQQEKAMLDYNQKLFQIEQQRKKRDLLDNKRAVQQQLAYKQALKQKQKQQRQRQKQQFNKKVAFRNNIQTQKEAVYKQYYSQFMQNQNRLQNVYENKTAPQVQQKQKMMKEFVRKQQQDFARQQSMMQQQRLNRAVRDKQMLRSYLQHQMEEKQRRKSVQLEQRRSYNQQVSQYQMNQKQYQQYQKLRKRQQQKRYDEDLANQIKTRTSFNKDSSGQLQRLHNPITNPIDFKIGITNPYVIGQYQDTKQRYVGDRDLKLKNLALVGNNSLTSH